MERVPPPPRLGRSILALRKSRGFSLEELARRSGVSKAMLSQIEQERTNPTVATVWKIARGLDASLGDLLGEGVEQPRLTVVRRSASPVLREKGCEIQIVSPIEMAEDLELYVLRFAPSGRLNSSPHFPRTEEIATALSGRFEIVSGDRKCILEAGDAAVYAADVRHSIRNLDRKAAEVFLVVHFRKA
ncbi:MAG: XRE family transcriptional regulator [Planctomycetota bacterium]|nr:XRE family transcriptional regulator [Planctomycetota bacterium]